MPCAARARGTAWRLSSGVFGSLGQASEVRRSPSTASMRRGHSSRAQRAGLRQRVGPWGKWVAAWAVRVGRGHSDHAATRSGRDAPCRTGRAHTAAPIVSVAIVRLEPCRTGRAHTAAPIVHVQRKCMRTCRACTALLCMCSACACAVRVAVHCVMIAAGAAAWCCRRCCRRCYCHCHCRRYAARMDLEELRVGLGHAGQVDHTLVHEVDQRVAHARLDLAPRLLGVRVRVRVRDGARVRPGTTPAWGKG